MSVQASEALVSNAPLTVCIDLGHLPSFVAFRRTLPIESEFDIEIEWLPMHGGINRLSADKPVSEANDPLAAYKARRQRARSAWAQKEWIRDCEWLGLTAIEPREVDARLLNQSLYMLPNEKRAEFIARAYEAMFVARTNVEDADVVAALVGTDVDDVVDGDAAFEMLQTRLLEAGVHASPAYIIEGELFQGRQHLPMIRWILAGREGIAPV